MSVNFERIQRIASDILQVAPEQITPESSQADITTWNSVRFLSLILAIEEEFGVILEPEEFDIGKNIGELTALLESKMKTDGRS